MSHARIAGAAEVAYRIGRPVEVYIQIEPEGLSQNFLLLDARSGAILGDHTGERVLLHAIADHIAGKPSTYEAPLTGPDGTQAAAMDAAETAIAAANAANATALAAIEHIVRDWDCHDIDAINAMTGISDIVAKL